MATDFRLQANTFKIKKNELQYIFRRWKPFISIRFCLDPFYYLFFVLSV